MQEGIDGYECPPREVSKESTCPNFRLLHAEGTSARRGAGRMQTPPKKTALVESVVAKEELQRSNIKKGSDGGRRRPTTCSSRRLLESCRGFCAANAGRGRVRSYVR